MRSSAKRADLPRLRTRGRRLLLELTRGAAEASSSTSRHSVVGTSRWSRTIGSSSRLRHSKAARGHPSRHGHGSRRPRNVKGRPRSRRSSAARTTLSRSRSGGTAEALWETTTSRNSGAPSPLPSSSASPLPLPLQEDGGSRRIATKANEDDNRAQKTGTPVALSLSTAPSAPPPPSAPSEDASGPGGEEEAPMPCTSSESKDLSWLGESERPLGLGLATGKRGRSTS
ncbi:hypothetical protein ACHAWF_017796 [Thalassiosira exigua]